MNAKEWIAKLGLAPHPEGGYYRETISFRCLTHAPATNRQYGGKRRSATSIYFLLESHDVSCFHRLKSDEIWYFYAGASLTVHVIAPDGSYTQHALGLNLEMNEQPQLCISRDHIFGATVNATSSDEYSVVSCMVSPGFDFADFELFTEDDLISQYPQHEDIIVRLTSASIEKVGF